MSESNNEWPEGEPAPAEMMIGLLHDWGRHTCVRSSKSSEFADRLHQRLQDPQPGDWVVETSAFRFDPDSVGLYITRMWDQQHPDGEEQHPDNHLHRVRALIDGQYHNWKNAQFAALPTRAIQAEVELAMSTDSTAG